MARRYATPFELATTASTYKTAGLVVGATTVRPKLYDVLLGQGGTPADNSVYWSLQRQTAAGTITAVTPRALDPGDPAAIATAGSNATVEGTITANSDLFTLAINQRASYRWVAAPGGEIIIPATASNGICALVKSSAYTSASGGTIHHEE